MAVAAVLLLQWKGIDTVIPPPSQCCRDNGQSDAHRHNAASHNTEGTEASHTGNAGQGDREMERGEGGRGEEGERARGWEMAGEKIRIR